MPPVTLVSRSLPTSSTLALDGGRWPPGPPCWSSAAGGGPSAGSQPRAWSGTDAPAAPAHSTRVNATTGRRKLLRNAIVLPPSQGPAPRDPSKRAEIYVSEDAASTPKGRESPLSPRSCSAAPSSTTPVG